MKARPIQNQRENCRQCGVRFPREERERGKQRCDRCKTRRSAPRSVVPYTQIDDRFAAQHDEEYLKTATMRQLRRTMRERARTADTRVIA